jgi:hypothetical protein
MAVVYQHRRKDNNNIFYIGIGKSRNRAYSKINRNKHWWNIVNKTGYEVDILIEGCTWKQACDIEKGIISSYGRADLGLGLLVNLTDGGEGIYNLSRETIEKRVNNTDYKLVSKKRSLSYNYSNPETIAKRINNTDYKNRKTNYKIFQQKRIKSKQIPVEQYDLEGNFIKTWESAKIAAGELNVNCQPIGRCCRNNKYYKTAYGFIWKYYKNI